MLKFIIPVATAAILAFALPALAGGPHGGGHGGYGGWHGGGGGRGWGWGGAALGGASARRSARVSVLLRPALLRRALLHPTIRSVLALGLLLRL